MSRPGANDYSEDYMGFFSGKSRQEYVILLIFLVFVLFFSFVRIPLAEGAAWILAVSGEIKASNAEEEAEVPVSLTGKKPPPKPAANIQDQGKAQTRNLPKTEEPIVLMTSSIPSIKEAVFAPFPKIRNHNGDPWDTEETDIRAYTDGKKLYFFARLGDRSPDSAITRHSEAQASSAWMDDGIELFLMRDKNSKVYCQYILSVSGIGYAYYLNSTDNPSRGMTAEKPKDFVPPIFTVGKRPSGFDLEIEVALSNVEINNVKPGDSFLIQFVRNYRGQGDQNSVTLQLFPTHIYADKRFGLLNHDRRAFQPVKIIDSTVYSTLSQEGENILKRLK